MLMAVFKTPHQYVLGTHTVPVEPGSAAGPGQLAASSISETTAALERRNRPNEDDAGRAPWGFAAAALHTHEKRAAV